MRFRKRHLWWLLAPVLFALLLLARQGFVHAQQQNAVVEIERFGGRVLTTHGEPDWLLWLTGNRAFRMFEKATVVNLSETAITDADLDHMAKLNGLERLNLGETEITDTSMEHLERLTDLKALDLSGTQITGKSLEHLANLTNLEYLYLAGTQVGDGDLHHLNGLSKLRHLDVTGTSVTVKGGEEMKPRLPDVEVKL
jgi:Leucine-rich repeat (LRR) protein